jgi:branched-subunit amino acid transport protein AzlD
MAATIFFCRAFPFIFRKAFEKGAAKTTAFLGFVEKTIPPVAMTVLAVIAVFTPVKDGPLAGSWPVLAASAFTAALHLLWKNYLLSIAGGTALYMALVHLVA